MRDDLFEAEAFDHYADRIRRGEADVYAAYRIFDRHWYLKGRDRRQVLRKAALLLLAADPWFLATSHASFLGDCLTARDLERVVEHVGTGLPADTTAYLRAMLTFHGVQYHDRDKAWARGALDRLARVTKPHRQLGWLDMLVSCHQWSGDWPAYQRAFSDLFAATDVEWRAHPLVSMLANAARRGDWRTYDRWRQQWDRLPPNHHRCDCHANIVCTCDGLRAVAARRFDEIPRHLAAAAAVHGCAHLNTAGFRLELAQLLVQRRVHLDACRTYLDRAAQFGSPKKVAALRRAAERAVAAAPPGPRRKSRPRSPRVRARSSR